LNEQFIGKNVEGSGCGIIYLVSVAEIGSHHLDENQKLYPLRLLLTYSKHFVVLCTVTLPNSKEQYKIGFEVILPSACSFIVDGSLSYV
jgi:hypothetical protein